MAKCRICNAAHAACGPATTVVPADLRVTTQEGRIMPLKRYRTTERVGRSDVETIVKLTQEQAEALGLEEYTKPGAKKPGAKKPAASSSSARKAAAKPANKAAPAPAVKPAAAKPAKPAPVPETPATGVDDASDPSASE